MTYSHVLNGEIKAITANWCLVDRTWGDTPAALIVCPTLGRRHHHVAQCCRNIQSPLASVYVYKKIVWVLSEFIEMLIKNILKKLKNEIMIWGIHYFITKQKTKNECHPKELL